MSVKRLPCSAAFTYQPALLQWSQSIAAAALGGDRHVGKRQRACRSDSAGCIGVRADVDLGAVLHSECSTVFGSDAGAVTGRGGALHVDGTAIDDRRCARAIAHYAERAGTAGVDGDVVDGTPGALLDVDTVRILAGGGEAVVGQGGRASRTRDIRAMAVVAGGGDRNAGGIDGCALRYLKRGAARVVVLEYSAVERDEAAGTGGSGAERKIARAVHADIERAVAGDGAAIGGQQRIFVGGGDGARRGEVGAVGVDHGLRMHLAGEHGDHHAAT
jgi:hypothetical protein